MKHLEVSYRPELVAEILRVSKRTIYRLIAADRLPAVDRRGRKRLLWSALSALLGEDFMVEKLLKLREIAEELGVHKSTVHRWFREGRLRGLHFSGKTVRIFQSSLDDFIQAARELAGELPPECEPPPWQSLRSAPGAPKPLPALLRKAQDLQRQEKTP